MLIGDTNWQLAEAVLVFTLILSLIITTFLFRSGEGNYSIKYKLMRRHEFFRENQPALYFVEILYKIFFTLPFLLLIALAILKALEKPENLASIMINGFIIILMLYPSKREFFYLKLAAIWVLAMGSQFSALFISLRKSEHIYTILSAIFYSANVCCFYLALLSIENCYWEISQGINKFKSQVEEVNSQWVKGTERIPKIFDGGLYGGFCRRKTMKPYVILYLVSIGLLIANAFLVRAMANTYLGFVGLVSNFIYDIFIKIFNGLESKGRSLTSVFIVLVAGRLLSFVFGIQLWLLGYCILYFGLAIFMGWMIIDRHFPLKQQSQKKEQKKMNAFKTPEFVLLILSVEILIMILVEVYALNTSKNVDYNGVSIPIWQWGILAVLAAWAIIVYMLSVRVLIRHKNKIHALTQYYFGLKQLTEYHAYIVLSILIVLGLGFYSHFYLKETVILISCIFLPLCYLCLMAIAVAWQGNDYKILADTDEYNQIQQKKREMKVRQLSILRKNTELKGARRQMIMSKFTSSIKRNSNKGFFGSVGEQLGEFRNRIEKAVMEEDSEGSHKNQIDEHDRTGHELAQNTKVSPEQIEEFQVQEYKPLRNWRESEMSISQIWECLTPNDRKIIKTTILLLVLLIGYCLASILWGKSLFGISLTVCLISYLCLFGYYRYCRTKVNLFVSEIIISWLGFILGISYWSVFSSQIVGPIVYGFIYVAMCAYFLQKLIPLHPPIYYLVFLGLKILGSIILILVVLGLYRSTVYVAVFAVIFFIGIILMLPLYFQLTYGYIPRKVVLGSAIPIIVAVVTLSVIGYVNNVLTAFSIFTIIMIMLFLGFLFASTSIWIRKNNHEHESPQIYCSYGESHYRFQSAKQVLKSNTNHTVLFMFAMTALAIYAAVVIVFFEQKYWGVYALSLFILLFLFITLRMSIATSIFIGEAYQKGHMTDEVILKSFLKVKNEYMIDEVEGEDSPEFLAKLEEMKDIADRNSTAQNWKNVVTYHDLYEKNVKEQQKFLFFWLALIKFNLIAKKREIMLQTLAELRQINSQLQQNGIFLKAIDLNLKPEQKYKKAVKEIEQLDPVDFIVYEQILNQHRAEMAKNQEVMKNLSEKEQKINNERDQDLYRQIKRLEKADPRAEIDNFEQLIKDLGRRGLYTDEDFPANQTSLGDLSCWVSSWRRPNVGEVLSKGGISANDVKQGMIGDCYLISSLGVLGEKRVKEALGYDADGKQRWVNSKGAYMIRFYKFSREFYVTIDDQLPVNDENEWVFAKSDDPSEIWPCIMEKAYAKLYSGYHNIVEGKCHRVFSEFTGGFPSEINLQQYKDNPNGLWTLITTSTKNGYLLGAGTPSNPEGDKAYSKRGIVQGHAYSVLDARQAEEYRILKIKNPHGSGGREWIGDFGDKSELLTKRMMSLLDHTPSDDGIFCMTVEDFIQQFRSLYICAVFDDRWKKLGPIDGEWTEDTSMGTPNNSGCQKNPHYKITVSKKSNIFISLSQEPISALKGRYPIYMRVQRNEGRRMSKQDISSDNLLGKPQRPIDAVMISSEMELEAPSYPYTFSLMVCCREPGSLGKFCLQMYSDDPQAEVGEMD